MDLDARREMNLRVLRRFDPSIVHIVSVASFAVLYSYEGEWSKTATEGPLFLFQRAAAPHGLLILNRNGPVSFSVDIHRDDDIEMSKGFIIYRPHAQLDAAEEDIYGIWVYESAALEQLWRSLIDLQHDRVAPAGESILDALFDPQISANDHAGASVLNQLFEDAQRMQDEAADASGASASSTAVDFDELFAAPAPTLALLTDTHAERRLPRHPERLTRREFVQHLMTLLYVRTTHLRTCADWTGIYRPTRSTSTSCTRGILPSTTRRPSAAVSTSVARRLARRRRRAWHAVVEAEVPLDTHEALAKCHEHAAHAVVCRRGRRRRRAAARMRAPQLVHSECIDIERICAAQLVQCAWRALEAAPQLAPAASAAQPHVRAALAHVLVRGGERAERDLVGRAAEHDERKCLVRHEPRGRVADDDEARRTLEDERRHRGWRARRRRRRLGRRHAVGCA